MVERQQEMSGAIELDLSEVSIAEMGLACAVHPEFICVCLCVQVMCVQVGGLSRRLHRHVDLNRLQDVALCWWNVDAASEDAWPWTSADTHRNNLVLISCSPTEGLKVHMHTQTCKQKTIACI